LNKCFKMKKIVPRRGGKSGLQRWSRMGQKLREGELEALEGRGVEKGWKRFWSGGPSVRSSASKSGR